MKEKFKNWNPTREGWTRLSQAQDIIDEYRSDGYTLTLRQLYYQFVAADLIENSERSYKNLGNLITRARESGRIDWSAIEDRNRGLECFHTEENAGRLLSRVPDLLTHDQWGWQESYVEVWVEKEALGGVIERACTPFMVPHLSCKGYLSASEAYRAGKRFERARYEGKTCHIIHLGDHDPSGIDMTRDNSERVNLFSNAMDYDDVMVTRLALNMNQIEEFSPPPNPTKTTDSRARDYISQFGHTSWELDALRPQVLVDMIQTEIKGHIDQRQWEKVEAEQKKARKKLNDFVAKWDSEE